MSSGRVSFISIYIHIHISPVELHQCTNKYKRFVVCGMHMEMLGEDELELTIS